MAPFLSVNDLRDPSIHHIFFNQIFADILIRNGLVERDPVQKKLIINESEVNCSIPHKCHTCVDDAYNWVQHDGINEHLTIHAPKKKAAIDLIRRQVENAGLAD